MSYFIQVFVSSQITTKNAEKIQTGMTLPKLEFHLEYSN